MAASSSEACSSADQTCDGGFQNPAKSRYALPPATLSPSAASSSAAGSSADPTFEYRLAQLEHLHKHYGSEIIDWQEIETLLRNCPNPVAYDGFEPSGRMHIAQGLMKAHFVNRLCKAGFTFLFWVADWFAVLNYKLGGDLKNIQTVGKYMIEVWRAAGMDMSRVRFLWASEEFSRHADTYWALVLDVATQNTLKRVQRCGQIMGRSDTGLSASQIFYPCMQAADVFFLGVDVCQLGMDQRKVNMLAREYADQKKLPKPAILSHPMVPGLAKGQAKMSKSDPNSAIFMEDSPEDVARKISKAFCPGHVDFLKDVARQRTEAASKKPPLPFDESEAENIANPILAYFRLVVCDALPEGEPLVVSDKSFASFAEMRAEYIAGNVHPMDMKSSLTTYLNKLIEPIRLHFQSSDELKELREQVIALTSAAPAKK